MAVDFYGFFQTRIIALPYISASARGELYRASIRAFESFLENSDPQVSNEEANGVRRQILDAIDRIEAEFDDAIKLGRRMPDWAWGEGESSPDPFQADIVSPPSHPPRSYDHPGNLSAEQIHALARQRHFGVSTQAVFLARRIRSISAIIRHYIHAMAGSDLLGYIWMIFEPVMQVTLVVAMYWVFGISTVQGMPAIPFAITGVGTWLMIRMVLMRLATGMGREFVLCTYPVVIPLDVKIAKTIFYSTLYFVVCGSFLAFDSYWRGVTFEVENLLQVFQYWVLLTIMAFGIGLIVGRLFTLVHEAQRLIMVGLRALYIFSGAFIVTEQLPSEFVPYFIWNPVLHGIQLFRSAYFLDYESTDANLAYFLIWTLAILVIGLTCERANYREEINA